MELKDKKIVILIEEIFNDHEFWYPYYRLKEAGAEVVVVGSGSADAYKGKSGTVAKPDKSVEQINAADFDGIVIPGGYAPDMMRRHPKMVQLVKSIFESGKVVAAICHAGWMLVSADDPEGQNRHGLFCHQRRHRERRGQLGRPGGGRGRQSRHQPQARRSAGLHENYHQGNRDIGR
jgi:protease I